MNPMTPRAIVVPTRTPVRLMSGPVRDAGPDRVSGAAVARRAAAPAAPAAADEAEHAPAPPMPPQARTLVPTAFGRAAMRLVLPNGVVLLFEAVRGVPTITIGVAIHGEAALDPPGLEGLALLCSELLKTGTERYAEAELLARIAELGTSVRTERYPDWIQIASVVLQRDLASALELLAEMVQRPRAERGAIDRVREELCAARRALANKPHGRLVEAFYRTLYGEHVYGTPLGGTLAGLHAITPADVRRFFTESYRPEQTVIAVCGDFDPPALVDAVAERFGAWRPASGAPRSHVPPERLVPPPPRPGVVIVDKPDQTQAHIRWGQLLCERNHGDWDALALGNHVLGGGGLAARIPARVRTREGLAYSARTGMIARRRVAPFYAGAQTRNDAVARTVEIMREEIERVREEPISEAELERARAQIAGTLRFRQETHAGRVATLLEAQLFDLGPDPIHRQLEHARRLGPDQVRDALVRHLDPERMCLVVLAPEHAVADALAHWGPRLTSTFEP